MIGGTGTTGLGGDITISVALMLKTVNAVTSGISGSVTMITGDESSGRRDKIILSVGSALSSTGVFLTVWLVYGDVGGGGWGVFWVA